MYSPNMKKQDGFITLAVLVITLIIAGGVTAGIVLHKQTEVSTTEVTGSEQLDLVATQEPEIENTPEEKPVVVKPDCKKKFGTMKNPSTGEIQTIRVHLLSPNEGKYNQGDYLEINWETCDLPVEGQLFRAYLNGPKSTMIVSGGPGSINDGKQLVKIPTDLPSGEYELSIEVLDMGQGTGDYITFDDSDKLITIGNVTHNDPAPPKNPGSTQTYPYVPIDPTNPYQHEAEAKGKLSSFRAEAEVRFDQNNGSYDGVCDTGTPSHNLFMEARQLLGMSQDNDCKENDTKYRVWVEMVSSNKIFCVDNTGHAGLISESSLSTNSYACVQ